MKIEEVLSILDQLGMQLIASFATDDEDPEVLSLMISCDLYPDRCS